MAYRATYVSQDPLNYFLQHGEEGSQLRIADIVLRQNLNPRHVFSQAIRLATDSAWSHSALLYLINDPPKGFENTFLIEAMTTGIRLANWRNEVIPFDEFTVGIKRPDMSWYQETPYEISRHNPHDQEDTHAVSYLRHVRGIALDQVNGLYDHKAVYELTALYAERVAKRHLGDVPGVAGASAGVAHFFHKWDAEGTTAQSVVRFMCSGLIQFSFFEALRRRISLDLKVPDHQEAARSNLSNLNCIIFREDLEGVIPKYIKQVQSGVLKIADEAPAEVINLLKTATPADFNNSPLLQWRYVIRAGAVWRIDKAADGYQPESEDEEQVLKLLQPQHNPLPSGQPNAG